VGVSSTDKQVFITHFSKALFVRGLHGTAPHGTAPHGMASKVGYG